MSLARRLTLLFTALAVVTAAVIGGLAYLATERSLRTQVESRLTEAAGALLAGQVPDGLYVGQNDTDDDEGHHHHDHASTAMMLAQSLSRSGTVEGIEGRDALLPVSAAEVSVAGAESDDETTLRTVTVDGTRYLMLTHARGDAHGAVQVAYTLREQQAVLARLAGAVLVISLVFAVAAAAAGILIARLLTRRLVRLTAAAEEVSATGRLDVDVAAGGSDEVGRLGAAFDTMLGRLARSREDQQRLIQDAGHELRTPLTSIRTNISLLRRSDQLPPAERTAVLDDLAGETRELTDLVNELVELATDRYAGEEDTDVDLSEVIDRVASRARRRSGRFVSVHLDPRVEPVVRGRSGGLERALSNLVDNALKFDTAGREPLEIDLAPTPDGGIQLSVSDRGPGIPDEDLERIFDRFHRAVDVRSLPGSGLGLSIVQDVATAHGGAVFAANRDGGGAVIGFTLPPERVRPDTPTSPDVDRATQW